MRRLSGAAASGRVAYEARFPERYQRAARDPGFATSLDVVVLEGELRVGDETLRRLDFAFVPPGGTTPSLAADHGARALVFFDPPVADTAAVQRQRERGSYVTHFDESRWRAATVARDAGRALALQVQDLKNDPFTTARTWFVKGGASLTVPWERHSVVEEGYLVEGDYRLVECLPGRAVVGEYGPGGYFRREAGIVHSGPRSGTKTGVVWLMRSPAKLDVVFAEGC